MSDELKLTLPDRDKKSPSQSKWIMALLVVLLIVGIVNVVLALRGGRGAGEPSDAGALPSAAQKALAMKLEKQGMQSSAAATWKSYLSRSQPGAEESAKVWYRIGKLYQEAGEHENALAEYLKVALLYAHEGEVAEALYKSGRVLEQQNRPDQARARYEEAREKGGEAPFAVAARQRLAEMGK